MRRCVGCVVGCRDKGTVSPPSVVPKSTVSFLGARGESWFVVTACSRSAKWALATRHPNQARDASPVTNTTQLNVDQHGKGLEFSSMMSTTQYTENGVSPPLLCPRRSRAHWMRVRRKSRTPRRPDLTTSNSTTPSTRILGSSARPGTSQIMFVTRLAR